MDFFNNFLTILLILVATIIIVVKYCFTYWSKRGVCTASPAFFIGNTSTIVCLKEPLPINLQYFYNEFKKKKQPFFGYYFFLKPIFVPIDLDLLKTINMNDFNHFIDHVGYVDQNNPLSNHLFNMKGDRWKVLRSKLTPSFTSGKMKMMFSTLLECTKNLTELLEEKVKTSKTISVKEISEKYTSDVVISCVFGLETKTQKNLDSDLYKLHDKVFGTSLLQSMRLFFTVFLPEFYTLFKFRMFDKDVEKFFLDMVKSTVKYREEHNIIRKDLMHLLLQTKNNVKISDNELGNLKNETSDNKEITFSMEELTAQCFIFYFAGYETSATTLSFALYELAFNLDIQSKLRNEINLILEKHDNEITYETAMDMEYLQQCIFETLRKYPPIPVNTRLCTKEYKIPETNVIINKGMYVLWSTYGIHYDAEYYPDPEKFDPERFSEENIKNRHPCAFMPFGTGPRMCIGYRFGLMQIKLALIVLLKRFKFTVHPDTKSPISFNPTSVILSAKCPIKLIAEKIQ